MPNELNHPPAEVNPYAAPFSEVQYAWLKNLHPDFLAEFPLLSGSRPIRNQTAPGHR